MNKLKIKSSRGITLIALIVTIIVLIILATISIGAIFGEDGIIKRAEEAKSIHLQGEQNDLDALQSADDKIGEILGEVKQAVPGELVTGKNAEYTDGTDTAVIPVGFAVVKDPDTIANGLVISDKANDDMNNSAKGNQFVWIPVEDYSKFHLIEGYFNSSLQAYLNAETNPSREAGASKTEILPGKPNTSNTVLGTDESIAMYKSVKDNGGFYIARFEAGVTGTTDNYTLTDAGNGVAADGKTKPLSQKGVGVWNWIVWGGTSEDTATDSLKGDDTADGAVKVARSMYTKSSTCGVTSTLCYGVQWDAVMNFIDPDYYKADGTLYNAGSLVATEKGYCENVSATGYYEEKHIYDLAGNVAEWTMESKGNERVSRGYMTAIGGVQFPASMRENVSPDFYTWELGFRVTLYI